MKCINCEYRDCCFSVLRYQARTEQCKKYVYSDEKENNKEFIFEDEA